MSNPLPVIAEILSGAPFAYAQQEPYCFSDTVVLFGSPVFKLEGLDSIRCRLLASSAKFFPSLGGGGSFLSNRNISGEIELRFLQGAVSVAVVEMLAAAGVPMPIVMTDKACAGTMGLVGTACRVISKGELARERETPLVAFTLHADRLDFFHGMRSLVLTR